MLINKIVSSTGKQKRGRENMKENTQKSGNAILSRVCGIHRGFNTTGSLRIMRDSTNVFLSIFFLLLFGVLIFPGRSTSTTDSGRSGQDSAQHFRKTPENSLSKTPRTHRQHFPLDCAAWNRTQTCPRDYPTTHKPRNHDRSSSTKTCPEYFRWIHEDLRHWKETGISKEMVEGARKHAHFRILIVDGRAYVERFWKCYQTRDLFTVWGIVQMLRLYPGRLPDLDLMFNCDDLPIIKSNVYREPNVGPLPLFGYCSDKWSLDIVFPDWSFWGWAEINIKPWKKLLKEMKEANKRTKWEDRVPLAYWKGNPEVAGIRVDLMRCNVSGEQDWNTVLYDQNWREETWHGFKQSNLANQCTHKYKIYIEGWTWSVSEKYIMACNSPTLYVTPHFYDFYIRGMVPQQHYWPIRDSDKCKSLKFAVEWGNNHTSKAKAIGEAASRYIHEDVKMDYVYDYMFHLLNEYAKLLKFKPTVPKNATELCAQFACRDDFVYWRDLMEETLEESPSDSVPCTMPPPYDPGSLEAFVGEKAKAIKQVEKWENDYWHSKGEGII